MIEAMWSRLVRLNRLNVEQHKNYSSRFELKIQRCVDFIADFKVVKFAIFLRLTIFFLWGYLKGLCISHSLPANNCVT